jgi:hypothetical protein
MSPEYISSRQASEMIDRLTLERNRCVEVIADQDGIIADLLEVLENIIKSVDDDDNPDSGWFSEASIVACQRARVLIATIKGEA